MQPLVEQAVPLLEEMDVAGCKKKLAPLKLDAATTSQILCEARWPEISKRSLIAGGPHSLAEVANWLHVPYSLKNHLLSLPAVAHIMQHRAGVADRIEKLVREFKEKEVPPTPATETKP